MILILVVSSVILVHAEFDSSGSSSVKQEQDEQDEQSLAAQRNFLAKSQRDYDESIDSGSLVDILNTGYDIISPSERNINERDLKRQRRQAALKTRNMAELIYGLPQYRRYLDRYHPGKSAEELRLIFNKRNLRDSHDSDQDSRQVVAPISQFIPLRWTTEKPIQHLRDRIGGLPR